MRTATSLNGEGLTRLIVLLELAGTGLVWLYPKVMQAVVRSKTVSVLDAETPVIHPFAMLNTVIER